MGDSWTLDFDNVNDEAEVYVNGSRVPWIASAWADERLKTQPERLSALKARATVGLHHHNQKDGAGNPVPDPQVDLVTASGWSTAGTNVVVIRCVDTAGRGGVLAAQLMKNGAMVEDVKSAVGQQQSVVSGWVITITATGETSVETGIAGIGAGNGDPIPSEGTKGTATFTASIADEATVSSVRVWLSLTHTYIDDLRISLASPDGTSVKLYDREAPHQRYSADAAFRGVLFTAGAARQLAEGDAPPYTGDLRPDGDLGSFVGTAAKGDWKLVVEDLAEQDSGRMGEWGVFIGA